MLGPVQISELVHRYKKHLFRPVRTKESGLEGILILLLVHENMESWYCCCYHFFDITCDSA